MINFEMLYKQFKLFFPIQICKINKLKAFKRILLLHLPIQKYEEKAEDKLKKA